MKTFIITFILFVAFISPYVFASNESLSVKEYVNSLNIKELIGQTLMVGYKFGNDEYESNKGLIRILEKYNIGNVILFKHNFKPSFNTNDIESARFVFNFTALLQLTASKYNPKLPLLIAIDQESGGQTELHKGVTRIPYAIQLGATRSAPMVFNAGEIVATELKYLGINTVLAPVADVNNNNENDIIGRRAFGANHELVTQMSVAFMKGLQKGNVLSVGKHFPGHGSSKDDPHIVLPILGYSDKSQLYQNDLLPFIELIKNGVDGIMTAHILAEIIDQENPVTISKKAISTLLRKELAFEGIVFTDDLSTMMGILKDPQNPTGPNVHNRSEISIKSYLSGNDILIFGQIENEENKSYPDKTVTEREFDDIHSNIYKYLASFIW